MRSKAAPIAAAGSRARPGWPRVISRAANGAIRPTKPIAPQTDTQAPTASELKVTTSSYGQPIARHHGRMRAAGTIIWATDLVEHKDKKGGKKGQPSYTSYSYTTSFAVALS